jgi:hypothetical protein
MGFSSLQDPVDRDRSEAIRETFHRIRRPLQWPMQEFRRKRIATTAFVGYRFSRVKRDAVAGFAFGFALRKDAFPGIEEPPEAVAYAFVEPVGSSLYEELVNRRGSPVRRLVDQGKSMGYPFEFHGGETAAAIRHRSLARLPPELFVLAGSDFFMISQGPMRAGGFIEQVAKATTRPGP